MIRNELNTIRAMIHLYCKKQHGGADLCPDCSDLLEYAEKRLGKCLYGAKKPQCKNCPTHCYAPQRRREISRVMRFSGPRMLFRHPLMTLRHALNLRKYSKPPKVGK